MRENAPMQGSSPATPPQEDTRWDLAKAETVGMATYEAADDYHRRYGDDNPFTTSYLESKEQEADIVKLEKPYERLYDLNPESFSYMSLPDFISTAKEFEFLEGNLALREQQLQETQALLSTLQGHLAKKSPYGGRGFAEELISIFGHKGDVTGENSMSLRQKMTALSGDFDLTPRQVVEKFIELTTKYVETVDGLAKDAKKESHSFREKHNITEELPKASSI